ncbi:ABC transporter permease subunit [Paraburkholderia sp. CNPSo 3157]|uniref:ABC transporter permease subunit n=1 Tax=Paraburkholderia franconis TaxID=2654983 RepID=A0A7X1NH97_9BURK|nr:amino acid ABC transporter permease [Paraburkholderia franconis]MPW21862.1 ABC transporter permease subunit [Paraburkholderia franconis]
MPTFNLSALLSGQYGQWLVSGFLMSIKLSVLAFAFSLPLGIVVALTRLAPIAFIRGLGQAYVEAIRNVPLLAHMLFWYFGAPELLPLVIKTWLYNKNYEAASALIALVLYTSAYMAEDIRSGIRSIPKEQLEASRALGFGFLQAMRLVVLPQSLRVTVPPLVNQTLNLWKNSSIAMVIGVAELMYQAQQVESATFRGFESFGVATAAYLTVSIAITLFSAWYQQRYPVRSM